MNASTRRFVLVALLLSVAIGAGLAYLASGDPDGLESAVLKTRCSGAEDPEQCLEDAAGDPVLTVAPAPFEDYDVTWLSGIAGVAVTFLVGAALVAAVRGGRGRDDRARDRATRGP